tara:strand:- start:441 stop:611 length:171 start_codon:yes stop_codon:yes gene_type:complete
MEIKKDVSDSPSVKFWLRKELMYNRNRKKNVNSIDNNILKIDDIIYALQPKENQQS